MYPAFCTRLNTLVEFVLAVFMLGMLVAIFCQVVFRFVLHMPLAWTEESSRYLMIYVVYLGASVGIYRGSHLGFTFLLDKMNQKAFHVMSLAASAGVLAFCVYFTWYGLIIVTRNMYQVSPALQLPMWCVYAILPISGSICALQTLNVIFRLAAESRRLFAATA